MKSGIEGYKNKLRGLKAKMPSAKPEEEDPMLEMEDAEVEMELEGKMPGAEAEAEGDAEEMSLEEPGKGPSNPLLAKLSDDELIEEIKRRGLAEEVDVGAPKKA